MPSLLRRHLTCFYCGARGNKKYTRGLRQWDCANCDASNYLDENGDITDPPVQTSQSNFTYAQPLPRSTSPDFSFSMAENASSDSIFCRTCIKNQHLYTENLASYLPSQSDARYHQFEANLPEYKAKLEKRYPQVCEKCRPKVEARINEKGKFARADYLRTTLERTRNGKGAGSRNAIGWGWQDALLLIGGIVWWTSILVQAVWHAMGAFLKDEEVGLSGGLPTFGGCVLQFVVTKEVEKSCFVGSTELARLSLFLGLTACWWHRKLSTKRRTTGGRLVGLQEYVVLQLLGLAIRGSAWVSLKESGWVDLPPQSARAVHLFMLVFFVIFIIFSNRTVQIDYTPRFSFLQQSPFSSPSSSQQAAAPPTPQQPPPSYVNHFPIDSLGDPEDDYPPSPTLTTITTTTHRTNFTIDSDDETEYDMDNAMEWTPSQPGECPPPGTNRSFYNQTPSRGVTSTNDIRGLKLPDYDDEGTLSNAFSQNSVFSNGGANELHRSPFQGRIPAAPKAPAHKAFQPNQPQNPFASASQHLQNDLSKQSLFTTYPDKKRNLTLQDLQSNSKAAEAHLRPPRWRVRESAPDTGLEGLFDTVFSLGDEPAEVRGAAPGRASGAPGVRVSSEDEGGAPPTRSKVLFAVASLGVPVLLGIGGLLAKGVWGGQADRTGRNFANLGANW